MNSLPASLPHINIVIMSAESGTVSIANKGKASVWTEEAKYEFLLRIIHQLKQGRSINWNGIRMKDRNTKSLTNQWTKVGKDISVLEDLEDVAGSAAPTPKKGTPAKRKTAVKNEDDEALQTPVKKRGRTAAVKKETGSVGVKKEEDADEAGQGVKQEDEDEAS